MNVRNFPMYRPGSQKKNGLNRLKHLYEISKHLATFENVEQAFPRMLSLAAGTFPLSSAVLIEKRGKVPRTTIWPVSGFDEAHIKRAITHARLSYSFLVDSTPLEVSDLNQTLAVEAPLQGEEFAYRGDGQNKEKYLVLPMVLDPGRIFGVLQLEAVGPLNEGDLIFVDALTNLIATALDRYYLERDEAKVKSDVLSDVRRQISALEEERMLREKFVSTLSHDLRTPLTAAKLCAQLIYRRPENIANCQVLAGRVSNCIDRVDKMIGDLLDANRIRAGERLHIVVRICDLSVLAADTVAFLRSIHGERLVLQLQRQHTWGHWNHEGLRRVIENLVNNAFKYGDPERPVTLTIGQTKHTVHLSVHNYGNPIPRRDQAGLFLQFRRAESSQDGDKKGWGLGLAMVQGMAQAHGGRVFIESSAERGTIFTLELPNDSRDFNSGDGPHHEFSVQPS